MSPARVLVVDDSMTMRALIRHALNSDPGIEVVGEAADPFEARKKMKALDPDVVTLDVEMPNMNGIEFLQKIMTLRPTPVIMVSNLTAPGAAVTLEALELGAFDCIAKPGASSNTFDILPNLIKEANRAKAGLVKRRMAAVEHPGNGTANRALARSQSGPDLIGIGSSTGGVEALMQVLAEFPADCPPTLIVQHLPAAFTASFAARLNRICPAHVSEAKDGEAIRQGHVYLAPGGSRHMMLRKGTQLTIALVADDPVCGHRPSVDVLFASIAKNFKDRSTGVILTGMGRDGAQGLLEMRKGGSRTLAQDEETSLVYGMPRVAYEIGAAQKRLPLSRVAREIFV
ncbi:chemotaxis response regulator protein-glutamate methylesterase [Aurantimonas sp. C2-6-R+9]|uniref:protein-glutamate methylesterase/protein-glutamine glutaminase n=1 Tax=unclassified Aurantimonas TaxID=2638230 RepID=UPI002E190B7F|nr:MULTISPECIES: chemotaxis response regulator protein-glutamate methylesterase [unclassified Aurantimonas]MEC5292697.1 chemotaxis response regulator protein-glutamate methylesterase [Aurantimonas sp. C2-3-R2]MEC5382916.1 chemotaxis response regulator protein-glutamate methylesterase [Aurantimonas sp. C2-6-R+9]MEC5413731.1 chemotaxis response regulator protein-glutamate methylesterase [Aurantimonas sp. C2-4-R8]